MSVWAVTRVTEWAVWEVPGEIEKGLVCVCTPASQAPAGPAHLWAGEGLRAAAESRPRTPRRGAMKAERREEVRKY